MRNSLACCADELGLTRTELGHDLREVDVEVDCESFLFWCYRIHNENRKLKVVEPRSLRKQPQRPSMTTESHENTAEVFL